MMEKLQKPFYLLLLALSVFLLLSSLCLYYPLGYHTNRLVFAAFLLCNLFWLPDDYWQYVTERWQKAKNTCLVLGSIFLLAFAFTGGIILMPLEESFDFDDDTVFLDKNYRIVVTSKAITSGGQSYIAVLQRSGLSESCLFKPDYCRVWDHPSIIKTEKGPALIVKNEKGICCDTLNWSK